MTAGSSTTPRPRTRDRRAGRARSGARWTAFLDRLDGQPAFYKVGLELFVAEGERAIELVQKRGGRVFLDLKLHDIPETVARAVTSAAAPGRRLPDRAHGRRRRDVAPGGRGRRRALKILAVTVLTSLLARIWRPTASSGTVAETVRGGRGWQPRRNPGPGLLAARIDDARAARARICCWWCRGFAPAGAAPLGDQKRVATPAATIRAGADYLVVGRPIRDAAAPAEAFSAIVREIEPLS